MALVHLQSVSLYQGQKQLFQDLSLQIDGRDRIGLVGPNGSGKTSLLRLVANEIENDKGRVLRRRELHIGYLPQELDIHMPATVLQTVLDAVPGRKALEQKLEQTQAALVTLEGLSESSAIEHQDQLVEMSTRLADYQNRLNHFEQDYETHRALRILAGLGFQSQDNQRPLTSFSGGWHMRAILASLLFARPDLLMLDEPTNHLDLPSVAWLSQFLRHYPYPFILICHDREFLNEQVNRIVSFEPEGVRQFRGNYETYVKQRAQEAHVLENRAQKLSDERQKAERFISRFRYKASKAKAVQSRIKVLEKLEQVETHGQQAGIHFQFAATQRCSKQVIKANSLYKSFGPISVLEDIQINVLREDKIAIMGVNGAGKSTLLKILAKEIPTDQGQVDYGHNVDPGYYAQHHAETLPTQVSVFDAVAEVASPDTNPTRIRTLLGTLGFCKNDVDKTVHVLSGGERARVALARLLIRSYNLLLMDEPTNHLDLQGSEQLAEALSHYDGTLVFASHNRSFVRKVATQIWNVAEQKVERFPGTLDEYMTSAIRTLALPTQAAEMTTSSKQEAMVFETESTPTKQHSREARKERKRQEAENRALLHAQLAPLKKEIDHLENKIMRIEKIQKERTEQLTDPAIFSHPQKSAKINKAFQADANILEELNQKWEALEMERMFMLETVTNKEFNPSD